PSAPTGSSEQPGDDPAAQPVACAADKLIAAVDLANSGRGGTLKLAENCTYLLTAGQAFNPNSPTGTGNGLPAITQRITLTGKNTSIVRAASAAAFRIFEVAPGGDLTLEGLTVNGGQAPAADPRGGGGILVDALGSLTVRASSLTHNQALDAPGGGAISNNGSTSLSHTLISDNSTLGSGGGIRSTGILTFLDVEVLHNSAAQRAGGLFVSAGSLLTDGVTVHHNTAGTLGGGIFVNPATTVKLMYCTVSGNRATGSGGGIENGGQLTLRQCTVNRNTATAGGGIDNAAGQTVIEGGEVRGNFATQGDGGGIRNTGALVVRQAGLVRNEAIGPASAGGGIANLGGTVSLTETRVTDNSAAIAPGGIATNVPITVDAKSVIGRNRPTD
ncbi:right-handed parallel beta-helix repeat-containing protein, partial [Micromonospora zhanjiangensis]